MSVQFPEILENGYLPITESYYIVAYPIILVSDGNSKEFKKQPKISRIYLGPYARKKFKTIVNAQSAINHLNEQRKIQSLQSLEYKIEGGGLAHIHNEQIRKNGFNCKRCNKPIRLAVYEGRTEYFHRNIAIKGHKAVPSVEVIQNLVNDGKV